LLIKEDVAYIVTDDENKRKTLLCQSCTRKTAGRWWCKNVYFPSNSN